MGRPSNRISRRREGTSYRGRWASALGVLSLLAACGGGGGGAADGGVAVQQAADSPQTVAQTLAVEPSPAKDAAEQGQGQETAQAKVTPSPTITVRASGTLAGGIGPQIQLRVDGVLVGSAFVVDGQLRDHVFATPALVAGSKVDLVFSNDAVINGEDRNLQVAYLSDGQTTVWPASPGISYDRGSGDKAFDGLDVIAGQGGMYWGGALRLSWPGAGPTPGSAKVRYAASRFLQQATWGASSAEVDRLAGLRYKDWFAEQMAKPVTPDFVNAVQAKFDLGDAWRPGGASYTSAWPARQFWAQVAGAPDPLRKRMAFALHHIFMVSQADSNLWAHSRAYANYLDQLNRLAFGNYRDLLEEMALSPAMGIYLSHLRNRKEDPNTGRLPDENFGRELMQLFSIGLVELNLDGTPRLDAQGKTIETYGNADVMAMAKVFTGWSWGFPDDQLSESNFRWGSPKYSVALDQKIDLQRMKAYPGQHSTAEMRLFTGKPQAVTIAAGTSAQASLALALDTLFKHPNVGPFIGRQLIQRLTTSHPSPAYVARVATVFNDNGLGVRGDLGAVLKAILLDDEARVKTPAPDFGKLKEPVQRVAQWLRAVNARSASSDFMMSDELGGVLQQAMQAPSVFGYFRPGYVPPGTSFAALGMTVPEMQIVNESSNASWVNLAESMCGSGLGWNGQGRDVSSDFAALSAFSAAGNVDALVEELNVLLLAGRMTASLKQDILDGVGGVGGSDATSHLNRARVATFVALAAPEFAVQR
jgi:uncharacterized protein (DUF1800 family)